MSNKFFLPHLEANPTIYAYELLRTVYLFMQMRSCALNGRARHIQTGFRQYNQKVNEK